MICNALTVKATTNILIPIPMPQTTAVPLNKKKHLHPIFGFRAVELEGMNISE